MPGFDGSGPQGGGPMTGGGRGYCGQNSRRGVRYGFGGGRMNQRGFRGYPPQGRGRGGFGFGRGRSGQYAAPFMMPIQPEYGYVTKENELMALREEAQDLKMMLSDVESRINALDTNQSRNDE
jgi:hypothetical protein